MEQEGGELICVDDGYGTGTGGAGPGRSSWMQPAVVVTGPDMV